VTAPNTGPAGRPGARRLTVRRGLTLAEEPRLAVRQLREAIEQPGMAAVVLFCSPSYDLRALGAAVREAFPCPVIGCTTSGQIGPDGYQRGGAVAASLAGGDVSLHLSLIRPLSECHRRALEVGGEVRTRLEQQPAHLRSFGLLLVDGLSGCEEGLAAALYQSLGSVPLVGGSAGDDLRFERTAVYWEGEFLSDAAVLALFETSVEFAAFKVQDIVPTDRKLVITAADATRRVVKEIDGLPAARAYADLLGVARDRLDASVYSQYPLLLRIGAEQYVRSVQRVNPDGSLAFFCAIEEGLVLRVGEIRDPLASLERGLREVTGAVGEPALVVGCDCILRRLEQERRQLDTRAGEILAAHRVVGFSTYGEQFDALHLNQTFTGIALGGAPWTP